MGAWLLVLFAGISALFWYHEWVYSLPTPVPVSYHEVKIGEKINVPVDIKTGNHKPVFLHFFNPDCPCSKFNMPHFKSLVKEYSDKVNFAIVVLSKDTTYTEEIIQNKFNLRLPVLFDKSIAPSCGVYSTPQAVILNKENILYYRGNYNKSRYCTDKNSDYAKMALDSLLDNNTGPVFSAYALTAYGCTLPTCNKQDAK